MLPSSLVTLSLLIIGTCGENPAIKLVLNNKGLQYGTQVAAGLMEESLETMSLPDVSGEVSLGFLGDVDFTLVGITVSQCDFPEPTVEFYEYLTGIKMSILGLGIEVTGEWTTHYGIIYDSGSFDLAVLNVDVSSIVELGVDADGRLSISSVYCSASVGDAVINFYGGGSWIFQPFVHQFHDEIIGKIEEKICPTVEQHIVDIDYRLQTMEVTYQVNQALAVDVPLTSWPAMDASSLSLPLKGQFHGIESREDPPFAAQLFTLPDEPGYMVSLGLSEFTTNSASYGYYRAGLLRALITDAMVPPGSPFHLNTSSLGLFIPQLSKLYPGLQMQLQVDAVEAPAFSFRAGAVRTAFRGAVEAFAVRGDAALVPLFKLAVDSAFSGRVKVAGGRLKGSAAMDNFTLTLVASEVGPFQTAALETLTKIGVKVSVLPKLNEILSSGFVLPTMQHARLTNAVLKIEEGFIAVRSDVEVLP